MLKRMVGLGGSSSIIVATINWLGENVPSLSLLLYGIGIFFVLLAISPIVLRLFKQRKGKTANANNKVYVNRTALTKERGSLADDLSRFRRVWAIFHTGTVTTVSGAFAKCHFERLILTDPSDKYMMRKLEPLGNNLAQYQNQIRQTAELAAKNGCEVRYYPGPIGDSLIIMDTIKLADNEFSDNALAHVETAIPFLSPDDRVSIEIENKDDGKKSFDAFLEHFNTVWARSNPIPQRDFNSGKSS